MATGTFGIIYLFGSRLKELVDLATTISFIIAPFVAIANYKLVSNLYLKPNDIPPDWLKYLAITGIVFLSGFSILFLYVRII